MVEVSCADVERLLVPGDHGHCNPRLTAMSLPPDHSAARTPVGGQNPPRMPSRFRETALASGLLAAGQIDACEQEVSRTLGVAVRGDAARWDPAVADCLVAGEKLTRFQADQLLAGRRKLTLGQYQILDELGRGGMGQVFRAQHVMMGRTVAIKVLPRAKSTSETEAAFQREIRMLGRLDHDHLVRALDAGHDGKVYYLVTELVPGIDLRRQVLKYGKLDEVRAASVISQAAEGLGYAHGQGLVHRDVKPANLLVTPEGHVKVLDLGLAGSVIEGESTRLGRVVGTMDYMAPEQIRAVDTVGPSADVYALGCTLYFALTGEVPFPGGTRQEKMQRQLSEQPRPIRQLEPGVSEDFCRVVDAMMRKNPAERLPSAQAVIERLRPWTPQSPLAMPRVKLGRSARADGGNESVGQLASSPRLPAGSSHGPELSVVEHQSTRGLLSEAEETDRGSGPHTDSKSVSLPTTFAAEAAGWGRLLVWRGMLAAAAAAILGLVVWMVFGGGQQGGGGVELPVVVGVAAFGLMLVVQLILAAVRVAGRKEP